MGVARLMSSLAFSRFRVSFLCGFAILLVVAGVNAQQGAAAASSPETAARVASSQVDRQPPAGDPNQALINRYCVTCHNQRLKTANVAFDTLPLDHPEQNAVVWERAIRKLRGGMMPPPGAPRPAATGVQALAGYLETTLDRAAAASPNPGSVRIHRLNRAEYQNAMRDMLAIDVDVSTLLPNDDISEGLDNIASALKVSPSFLDQYIMAARDM
jgi:mono/diheme cytochrome c family protein